VSIVRFIQIGAVGWVSTTFGKQMLWMIFTTFGDDLGLGKILTRLQYHNQPL
jgi:hypothetical protein